MIYVLVYKEIAAALTINSAHTKFALLGLHPNIHVIRDPDVVDIGITPWSHHSKMVPLLRFCLWCPLRNLTR